ncbi:MAG TPA: THUMP domain-containing protein [Candidatus Deferrimicrobium sp.]|nr:THUMP domain-containing protein [Candidatus Deferrimicrobium sp.]
MQKNFNLLISCPRFHEKDAIAEVWYLFSNIGDEEVKGHFTNFPGLIIAKTSLDPFESIQKLRNLIREDPLILRFVLKVMPIEFVVETTAEDIIKTASEYVNRFQDNETFRITIKNRFSPLDTTGLIVKIAEFIDRKVDLTHPDKEIMIQILGNFTGITLLTSEDVLAKVQFNQ